MESESLLACIPEEPTIDDCDGDQDLHDFKVKGRERLKFAIELYEKAEWELVKGGDGVNVYKTNSEDSDLHCVKRETEVETSPDKAMEATLNHDNWKECHPQIIKSETIENLDETTRLISREFKGNLVISDRDMSIVSETLELTNGLKVDISFSQEHELIPATKAVRAELDFGLLIFKPLEDNKTQVVQVVRANPKGSIPTSMVNSSLARQHASFLNLQKLINGKGE